MTGTNPTADHRRLLGVGPGATPEELRAAYVAKLRLWHPDLAAGGSDEAQRAANEMTARLNEAYERLSATVGPAAPQPARRGDSASSRPVSTSPPRRGHGRGRADRRVRDLVAISVGGIALPLFGLVWSIGLLGVAVPPDSALIMALCVLTLAATVWTLASSRVLRRPDRLGRIGVIWARLMRMTGWLLVAGCVVLLGLPAIFLILMAAVGLPFFGLALIAMIDSRLDSKAG